MVDFESPAQFQGAGAVTNLRSAAIDIEPRGLIELRGEHVRIWEDRVLVTTARDPASAMYREVIDSELIVDDAPASLMLGAVSNAGLLVSEMTCTDVQASATWIDGLATQSLALGRRYDQLPAPHYRENLPRAEGDLGLRASVIGMSSECLAMKIDVHGLEGLVRWGSSQRLISGSPTPIADGAGVVSGAIHYYYRIEAKQVEFGTPLRGVLRAGFATNPTFNWTGDAYLPRGTASQMPSGASVDDAGALVLRGNFTLQDFASDGERMQASIGGDPELWLDGAPVQVASQASFAQAAAAGIVALAISIVAKYAYGAALFTRLPADEALKHPRRQALAAYIEDNPGATFRELVREVGVPAGTCRHHLSVLQRADVIVEHRHRATVRFFENHGKFDSTWETVVMLREDDLAKVHGFIESHPGSMQKTILQHASEQWGWSRSTTQHRLQRLVDAGVVTIREIGRRKEYSVPEQNGARRAT